MTQVTATLADFLLARIAEDQAEARQTVYSPGPHRTRQSRWLLAECEAKRRIVGRLVAAQRLPEGHPTTEYAEGYDHGILDAVRFLALPYASHADYRPEWRP